MIMVNRAFFTDMPTKRENTRGRLLMNAKEVLRKADAGEGLTIAEAKLYQKLVKPVKHT